MIPFLILKKEEKISLFSILFKRYDDDSARNFVFFYRKRGEEKKRGRIDDREEIEIKTYFDIYMTIYIYIRYLDTENIEKYTKNFL